MSWRTAARWIIALLSGCFLLLGSFQLLQGLSLGWTAIGSAGLLVGGLILAINKVVWGQLLFSFGAVTAVAWLFTMLMGFLGRGYDFSYGGWGAGIGVAIAVFVREYQDERAARWHKATSRRLTVKDPEPEGPNHSADPQDS